MISTVSRKEALKAICTLCKPHACSVCYDPLETSGVTMEQLQKYFNP